MSALNNFNVKTYPWKAHCWAKWFLQYFEPIVEEHHHLEETILFPFYTNLGAVVPPKQCADHKEIVAGLKSMVTKTNELLAAVKADPSSEDVTRLADEIRDEFRRWNTIMLEHLADEEMVWPNIYKQYGEGRCGECLDKILNEGIKHGGHVFEEMAAAVLNAMGYEFPGYPLLNGEKGWACPTARKRLLNGFPAPVRMFLLPSWNKRFHINKGIILSIAGNEDVCHIIDRPNYYHGCCNVM